MSLIFNISKSLSYSSLDSSKFFILYLQEPKPEDGVYLNVFISSSVKEDNSIIFPFNIPSIPFRPAYTLLNAPKSLFACSKPTTLELITDVGPPD